jgi:hypothetical protein
MVGRRRTKGARSSSNRSPAGSEIERTPTAKRTLVSVYRRSGAYFVVSSAKTTEGLWVYDGEPRRLSDTDTVVAELGGELLARLAGPRRVVGHPAQHEWPEHRRASLAPILQLAKVCSWRSFVSMASLVEAEQFDGVVTISPMRPMPKPIGAFEPDSARTERLNAPSSNELGEAILHAFTAAPHP